MLCSFCCFKCVFMYFIYLFINFSTNWKINNLSRVIPIKNYKYFVLNLLFYFFFYLFFTLFVSIVIFWERWLKCDGYGTDICIMIIIMMKFAL